VAKNLKDLSEQEILALAMKCGAEKERKQDVDLAKAASPERSCSHETLGLGQEEPSFDHARHSHSRRCDCVSHDRAARANA